MKILKHPTIEYLEEESYIICGKENEIEIYNDAPIKLVESFIEMSKYQKFTIRFIKRDIKCPVCGENLHKNGTSTPYWNKDIYVKTQNYCHKKCKCNKYTHLYKYKNKSCCYTKKIQYHGFNYNLLNYNSYYSKKEMIIYNDEVYVPVSTIYYHEYKTFEEFFEKIHELQQKKLAELKIKPSGVYCYDEQYIFVGKVLYMRMTIIDSKNKLIIGDELVKFEDFDDNTIKKFLEEKLENLPLKVIITDGKNSYKSIIESLGAIHHRCLFHLMQNLMTPLQRKINQLENSNTKKEAQIEKNEKSIHEINKKYKGVRGRTSKKDKKRRKDYDTRDKLENINKHLQKKMKANKDLKDELTYNKERIQNIFKVDTKKDAKRRFNTLYNSKDQQQPIIQRFLERMKKNLELLINHLDDEDIPATNNTVENYYRTTLPGKHKRIYRTLKGAQKRIQEQQLRWTHRIVLQQKDDILNHKTQYNNLKIKPQPRPITII